MPFSTNFHKIHINDFCNKNKIIKTIYGGATSDTDERKKQHDNSKQIKNPNYKKITTLTITDKHTIDEFIHAIKDIEQYLIDMLFKNYKTKCINDTNKDKTVAQRGGAGFNKNNLKVGDIITFYVYYN